MNPRIATWHRACTTTARSAITSRKFTLSVRAARTTRSCGCWKTALTYTGPCFQHGSPARVAAYRAPSASMQMSVGLSPRPRPLLPPAALAAAAHATWTRLRLQPPKSIRAGDLCRHNTARALRTARRQISRAHAPIAPAPLDEAGGKPRGSRSGSGALARNARVD
jgi:hypothetical protein